MAEKILCPWCGSEMAIDKVYSLSGSKDSKTILCDARYKCRSCNAASPDGKYRRAVK